MVEVDIGLLSTIFGLVATLVGVVVGVYKICQRFNRMEESIDHAGRLHRVLAEGLFACLDGLQQQGCNGQVTKAHEALRKPLFEELEQ